MQVQCFSPIADDDARILILGSMPGTASLEANRYYAHPRNAFWPIMGELFGAGPNEVYDKRFEILKTNKIGLWDVLGACFRKGSLDSEIDLKTIMPNDFKTFFRTHPSIKYVFFNGSKAEEIFRKRVLPTLSSTSLHYQKLPSTSPAHAALSFQHKLAIWEKRMKDAMCNFA